MRWAAFRGLFYSMRQVPIALEQEQMPRKNTYTQAHRVKAHEDFQTGHVIVTEKTPQKAIELAERLIESVKFETV